MNRSEASAPHGGAHPPSFPGGLGKVSAREHHTARATPLIPEGTTPPLCSPTQFSMATILKKRNYSNMFLVNINTTSR